MQPREEAPTPPRRPDLDAPQARQFRGVEQVEARRLRHRVAEANGRTFVRGRGQDWWSVPGRQLVSGCKLSRYKLVRLARYLPLGEASGGNYAADRDAGPDD